MHPGHTRQLAHAHRGLTSASARVGSHVVLLLPYIRTGTYIRAYGGRV